MGTRPLHECGTLLPLKQEVWCCRAGGADGGAGEQGALAVPVGQRGGGGGEPGRGEGHAAARPPGPAAAGRLGSEARAAEARHRHLRRGRQRRCSSLAGVHFLVIRVAVGAPHLHAAQVLQRQDMGIYRVMWAVGRTMQVQC